LTLAEVFLYSLIGIVAIVYLRRLYLRLFLKHYSAAEVAEKLKSGHDLVLLDVRTKQERTRGSIPGSLHIPLHELPARIGELEHQRRREIVCFCQTGNRSLSAAAKLKRRGFSVANLRGGIAEWNFTQQTAS
jgi:rhodanese-related sulfurtransferase